jgi:hypothetical protein
MAALPCRGFDSPGSDKGVGRSLLGVAPASGIETVRRRTRIPGISSNIYTYQIKKSVQSTGYDAQAYATFGQLCIPSCARPAPHSGRPDVKSNQ